MTCHGQRVQATVSEVARSGQPHETRRKLAICGFPGGFAPCWGGEAKVASSVGSGEPRGQVSESDFGQQSVRRSAQSAWLWCPPAALPDRYAVFAVTVSTRNRIAPPPLGSAGCHRFPCPSRASAIRPPRRQVDEAVKLGPREHPPSQPRAHRAAHQPRGLCPEPAGPREDEPIGVAKRRLERGELAGHGWALTTLSPRRTGKLRPTAHARPLGG